MAVGFRSAASDSNGVGGISSLTIPLPAGVVDGDFLVASIKVAGGSPTTITPPSGWRLVRRVDNGSTISLAVYVRFASGESSQGWCWNFSATGFFVGGVSAYVGVDTYTSLDAEAGLVNPSGTNQPTPAIVTSLGGLVLVASIAVSAGSSITMAGGLVQRHAHFMAGGQIAGADVQLGGAGSSGVFTPTVGFGMLGCTHVLALRPSPARLSAGDAFSVLASLLPPGEENLYDLGNKDDDIDKLFRGIADSWKRYGFDAVDEVRQEFQPASAAMKLPDWEGALGITAAGASAANPWIATRQNAIVSKLRESGATTIFNVAAVVEKLLGYSGANLGTIQVLETLRGDFTQDSPGGLTQPHTYTNGAGTVIGAFSFARLFIKVIDDGVISAAGAQVKFTITCTNPEQLSFSLIGPNGGSGQFSASWGAKTLPSGAAVVVQFILGEKAKSAGKTIGGQWEFDVFTGAAGCTISSVYVFVEGAGKDAAGNDGLGCSIFEWGVFADPTKVNAPDYVAVQRALARITPGTARPRLIRGSATVSAGQALAIPDDPSCIPDQVIPA